MKSVSLLAVSLMLLLASTSCNSSDTTRTESTDSTATKTAAPRAAITLTDMAAPSPEFPGASLQLAAATAAKASDSAKASFAFTVKNYELKNQTSGDNATACANSKDGQHIHFILDNQPYKALYEPKNEVTLPLNTEHWLLCFLSRSYHESLKNKEAALLVHFKIDAAGKYQKLPDAAAPMLFYSRPKGDYLGKDTSNILLDFYPWNFVPGKDGYTVKADVKNETTGANASFTLKEWKPKVIKNLGEGKCTVTLTLLGKDGQPATGENTSITRKVNLAAAEPMK